MSNTNSSQAPGQNKTVTIIVNGRPREVTGKTVSYEEIVKLASQTIRPTRTSTLRLPMPTPTGRMANWSQGRKSM